MHLVGFIIRMYHDARSSGCQNYHESLSTNHVATEKVF